MKKFIGQLSFLGILKCDYQATKSIEWLNNKIKQISKKIKQGK